MLSKIAIMVHNCLQIKMNVRFGGKTRGQSKTWDDMNLHNMRSILILEEKVFYRYVIVSKLSGSKGQVACFHRH